jgi:hypothetical protein
MFTAQGPASAVVLRACPEERGMYSAGPKERERERERERLLKVVLDSCHGKCFV